MSDEFRMEGPQNGYGSYFSPANFSDCDEANAGLVGEFTASKDYVSMGIMMENLSVSTMNLIEDEFINNTSTNDKNNIDKVNIIKSRYMSIKNKLVSLGCAGHLEQINKFIKPIEEQVSYERVKDIANKLKVETFNGFSKGFFSELNLDLSGAAFFNDEFGIELESFRTTLKKVCESYDKAYFDLFESDEELMLNIKKFTELSKQLNTILLLDVNDASLDVFASITKYLSEFFKKQNIKEKFDTFLLARKKFIVLRDLIMMCHKTVTRTDEGNEAPNCTICINNPVKMAFVPCGHTFCLSCATKQNLQVCYICRTKIGSKLKLYYL
jgi:hypothetical protein